MACSKYTLTNTGSTLVNFNYRRCDDALWQYQVELNPNSLPHISINRYYASLIQQVKNKTDQQYLKNNLQMDK